MYGLSSVVACLYDLQTLRRSRLKGAAPFVTYGKSTCFGYGK
jgi:hypothetical protein